MHYTRTRRFRAQTCLGKEVERVMGLQSAGRASHTKAAAAARTEIGGQAARRKGAVAAFCYQRERPGVGRAALHVAGAVLNFDAPAPRVGVVCLALETWEACSREMSR